MTLVHCNHSSLDAPVGDDDDLVQVCSSIEYASLSLELRPILRSGRTRLPVHTSGNQSFTSGLEPRLTINLLVSAKTLVKYLARETARTRAVFALGFGSKEVFL